MEIDDFVNKYFSDDLEEFQRQNFGVNINLSVSEKTIIYKYALDYYEDLNSELRYGGLTPVKEKFCQYLNEALDKLPEYKGIVYRGVKLKYIQRYLLAFSSNTPVIEKGFLSTSTSQLVANKFGRGLVEFIIFSKHGRLIQDLSRYGSNSSENEKEVLFKSGTEFLVLDIEQKGSKYLITLEEV